VLNKNIYYVVSRLHSTLPVCRLMQKGPCKRHLAAEACTTTDLPIRECFQFLLGPPTYKTVFRKNGQTFQFSFRSDTMLMITL